MILIRNFTIRGKLIAIIMAACVLSLMLAGAVFIGWGWFNLRHTMVRTLTTQAQMLAQNNKAAVEFKDPVDANNALQSLTAESSIVFGAVFDQAGNVLAEYVRSDVDKTSVRPSGAPRRGHSFDADYLTVYERVIVDNKSAGMVCLRSDLQPLYEMMRRNVTIVCVVLLVASSAAYVISSILQRVISRPILELADVARVVSDYKEYSVRATKLSNDEVGALIDAFNGMLEQIQQRDAALVSANTDLERKVDERTAALREEVAVRKRAEEALEDTVKKLTRANAELGEFTRISAHDLKTPLRAIGTLADWIAEDYTRKADKEGRENARLLLGRARRMSNLLDAIMAYTEITIMQHVDEPLDLTALAIDVIRETKRPPHVRIALEGPLPVIDGDPKLLTQLLRHLLDNAVKYIDKPAGLIRVGCEDDGDRWRFHVSDNGCGIENKYFDKIFRIFQILANRDETEDVGIGLAIVKKIVEFYEGKVWVESRRGEGSTFYFTLPKESKSSAVPSLEQVLA